MHGTIYAELKKYVLARLGAEAWNRLLDESALSGRIYDPGESYPDEELVRLVQQAARAVGQGVPALLEDFGEFMAPDLLSLHRRHLNPRWRTLDLLEHTEQTIHRIVRVADPGAQPPVLVAHRISAEHLKLEYRSARQLCAVARGIIHGTARHFGEQVAVDEPRCLLRGDACCELDVRLLAPTPAPGLA